MRPCFEVTALCNVLIIFAAWAHSQMNIKAPPQPEHALLISLGWVAVAVVGGFLLLMLFEAARFRKPGRSMESLGANADQHCLYAGGLVGRDRSVSLVSGRVDWIFRHRIRHNRRQKRRHHGLYVWTTVGPSEDDSSAESQGRRGWAESEPSWAAAWVAGCG